MRIFSLLGILLAGNLFGQTSLNLATSTTPTAASAQTVVVSLTASGFPSGTISAADLMVALEPVGAGPTASVTPVSIASVIGSTRRVSFRIPSSFAVLTSPAAYRVRISSVPLNLVSTNFANLTVNPPARLLSAVPNSAAPGTSIPVTITGLFSNFINGSSVLTAGEGISVSGVSVINRTTLNATLTIAQNATPGVRSFSVSTGLEVASGANLFTVSQASASSISSVAPNAGAQSTTVPVVITGLNTNWNGSTTATMNGLTVNITSATATQINANVVIPNNAALGARTLNLSTGETLANAFTVTQGVTSITGVAPNTGAQSTTVPVVISGLNTNWNGSTTATLNGLTVNITSATATQINANVVIPNNSALGARTLTLSTGETLANAFTVTQGVTSITSVAPNAGAQSTTVPVVISGLNTNWNGSTTATLNGLTVNITGATATQINANVVIPDNAALGARTLTLSTGETLANAFTVSQNVPSITSVAPNTGAQSTTVPVVISGLNTNWNNSTTATMNGLTVNITSATATQINANVVIPNNAALGARTLTLSTGETLANAFTVTQGVTSITSVAPNTGAQSTTVPVVITGVNTNWNNSTVATMNGLTVNLTSATATQINANVVIPNNATLGARTLTLSTGETLASAFTVNQGVTSISSVAPNTGAQSTTVPVVITGLNTNWNGSTTATMNGLTVNITGATATQINANVVIPNNATLGARTLTLSTGETLTNAFTVTQGVKSISQVAPNSGAQGSSTNVVITGINTTWAAGLTASLGAGITVNVNTVTPTEIQASVVVPNNTTLGGRTLTLSTGESLANAFTVTQGPTSITSIVPNEGFQSTVVAVVLTGVNTNWNTSTTLNLGAGIVAEITSATAQQINANLSIQNNSAIGLRNLSTSTGESLANAFLVKQGTVSITSVNPGAGSRGTTLNGVVVTGVNTNFTAGTVCSFGNGITVDNLSLIDVSRVSVRLQIANNTPLGTRVVACTTGAETALSNDGAFVVNQGTVTISGLSPNSGPQGANNLVVSFSGVNTSFVNGQTSCSLGGGIVTNSTAISSSTSGSVNVNIPLASALGSRTLTCTTGLETVSSAAGAFSVTAGGTPTISSVVPVSTVQGSSTANITVTGQFTNFQSGSTTLTVDAPANGLSVSNLQVQSPTSLTFTATATAIANTGSRNLRITTGSEIVSTAFSVSAGNATLSSVSPNNGTQGESNLNVTVTGTNTHFTAATPSVSFGANITVANVAVLSDTQLTATLSIAANATTGPRSVFVSTGGESASGSNIFTVNAATPTISLVSPSSGAQGATLASITLTGAFTEWSQAGTTVVIEPASGITVGSVTVNGPTSITLANVQIGQTTNGGNRIVRVVTGPQQLTANFNVSSGPASLTSLNPNSGSQGTTLTGVVITGSSTNFTLATPTVNFSGSGVAATNCSVQSNTQLTCDVTIQGSASLGVRAVSVSTGGEVASGATFNVILGSPTITSLSPTSVIQTATGIAVEVNGAFTNFGASSAVSFNSGSGISVNSVNAVSATQLMANLTVSPIASLGLRQLTVTTGGEVVTSNFTVNAGGNPQILTISIPQGTQTSTITGQVITAANTHFTLATPIVSFGSGIVVSNVTVQSNTQLTCDLSILAGAAVGARSATVTTGGQVASSAPGIFAVNAGTPTILSLSPSSRVQGASNQNLTVTGEFTAWDATTTAGFLPNTGVSVNSVTVNSATSLTVNVSISALASTGARTLRVSTGAQNLDTTFAINPGSATISSISPNSARQNQVLQTVTITGSNTNFAAGTTTVSFPSCAITASAINVLSPTSLTVSVSVSSVATIGTCDVRVSTAGEVANGAGLFTVQPGLPVLSSINPVSARQGQTIDVGISGQFTNFINGVSTASFGAGIAVNSLTVQSPTSAIANISVAVGATLGGRNLSVTTNTEIANLANALTVQAGTATLLSVNPPQGTQGNTLTVAITGAFTNFTQGLTTASFGAGITTGTVTINGPTLATVQIQIQANASIGPRTVTLTTGSETATISGGFQVQQGVPLITVINPNIGTPNQNVNVTLTGVFTNFQTGQTTARFGAGISVGGAAENTFGPVVVNSPTSITASLSIAAAAALGTRSVEIQNPNAISVVDGFTVQSATPTAPTIISVTPASGNTNVALNSKVILTFDQPIDRNTVTPASFRLREEVGFTFSLPAAVEVDATGRIATLTPNTLLPVSRGIRWFASGSGTEIRNPAGTAMAATNAAFTTGFEADNSGPSLSVLSPAAGFTDVPLNARVMARFDKPIDTTTRAAGFRVQVSGVDVPGSYSFDNTRTILTFVASGNLTANTQYSVLTTSELRSSTGLALVSPATVSFSTGVSTLTGNGSVSFINPANGATNVPLNTSLQMTFNRVLNPITFNSGNFFLRNENTFIAVPGGSIQFSADLRTVFLSFGQELNPSTVYRFLYQNSATDLSGNFITGINSAFTTGTNGITTPPQVSSVNPANGTTGLPVNPRIEINFSQPMLASSVSAAALQFSPAIAGTVALSANGLTLSFTPTANLAPSTLYTVNLSGLTNVTGLPLPTFTSTFTTGATATPDTTLPTISSRNPAASATNIATNSPVSITFSEAISAQSILDANTLRVTTSGSQNYSGSLSLSPDGRTLTFTPSSPYAANSTINVRTSCDASIRDLAGNAAGCIQVSFSTANTPDTTPFQVISMTPSDGSTGLGPNATVVLTLNKPANTSTVNAASVNLFRNTNSLGQNPTLSAGGNQITLQLSGAQPGETLEVAANNLVLDLSGNPLVPFVGRLTTAVFPAQGSFTISSIRPANGATSVSPNLPVITLIASRPLNPGSLAGNVRVNQNGILFAGTVSLTPDGQGITFVAPGPFLQGARVDVDVLPGLLDTSGNSVSAFSSSFTVTADLTSLAPAVTSVSPNGGPIPNNAVFEVTFSKAMDPASFTTVNFFIRNESTFQAVAANPPVFSNGNRTVRIRAVAPLQSGITHRLIVGNVRDVNNISHSNNSTANGLAGASADTFPPAIDSIVPGDGISNIGPNASIAIRFSEPVNRLTINPGTITVTGGGYSFNPTSISFTADSREVFLTPSEFFPASSTLTLTLNGIEDIAGNVLPVNSLQFTTSANVDLTPASVSSFSVSSGQEDVPTNSTFSVNFSEPVDPRTVQPIFSLRSERTLAFQPISPVTFSADYRTFTFAPQAPLNVGESYRLFLNGSTLDFSGNVTVATNLAFRAAFTADTTPPTVLNVSPGSNFSAAPTNSRLEVWFDRPIRPETVNNVSINAGGSPISLASRTLSNGNRRLILLPNLLLGASTAHSFSISEVASTAGTMMAGTVNSSFTTGVSFDRSNPAVSSLSPASNTTGVPTNPTLQVQFTEPVIPFSVDSSEFSLRDESNLVTLLGGQVNVAPDQRSATLTFASPLKPFSSYRLFVSNGIRDLAGNALNGTNSFFTTGSGNVSAPPLVTSVSPATGNTEVPVNGRFRVQFNQPLNMATLLPSVLQTTPAASFAVSVVAGTNNTMLEFTPVPNLAANQVYTATLSGISATTGLTMTPFNFSFTTTAVNDTTAPTISSRNPASGAAGVAVNGSVSVTLSEAISAITLNAASFRLSTSITGNNTEYSGARSISADLRTITFTPSAPFRANSTVNVRVSCEALLRDLAGNSVSCTQVSFTTANTPDNTSFVITSFTPPSGTTEVNQANPVLVQFNRPLNQSTVNCDTVFLLLNQSVSQCPTVTEPNIVSFASGLTASANYTIVVTNGIQDTNGNAVSPLTSTFSTSPMLSSSGPSVVSVTPSAGATVPANASFSVFFNIPMAPASLSSAIRLSQNGVVVPATVATSSNGVQATLTPLSPLPFGSILQLYVERSAISSSGVSLGSVFNSSFNVVPDPASALTSLSSFSPSSGLAGVPLNTRVELRYDLPLNPASLSSSTVFLRSNTTFINVPASLQLLDSNRLIRLTPNAALPVNTNFTWFVSSGLQAANGAAVATANSSFTTGATAVTSTPSLLSSSPIDAAVAVATNARIRLSLDRPFNRAALGGVGVVAITGGGYDFIPASFSFDTPQDVIITPLRPFPPSATLNLSVNGLSDLSGNLLPNFSSSFTTATLPDVTGPSVQSFSILNGATNVPVNTVIEASFSEPVDPRSFEVNSRVQLRRNDNFSFITGSVSFSSDRRRLLFTPAANLTPSLAHSFFINANYLDSNGVLGNSSNISFNTSAATDIAPPTISFSTPNNGQLDVLPNTRLGLRFSEPVSLTSLEALTVSAGGTPIALASTSSADGQRIINFVPATTLAPNTLHTISISGVRDLAGNPVAPLAISFTTGASASRASAILNSVFPAANAVSVPVAVAPVITFSPTAPAVDVLSALNSLRLQVNATSAVVPTTITISADGRTVTLTPTVALAPNTTFRIVYDNGLRSSNGEGVSPGSLSNVFTTAP